jgi:tetratricopeptide (TPR) repeat protein
VKKDPQDHVERDWRAKIAKNEADEEWDMLVWNLAGLAKHLLQRKRPKREEALVVTERALQLKRQHALAGYDPLLLRADVLQQVGRFAEAIPLIEEAIPHVHELAQVALRARLERLQIQAWLVAKDDARFVPSASAKPSSVPREDREDREDDNFKLAILDTLLRNGLITAVDAVAEDEYEASHSVKWKWLEIEPTPEQLATITCLFWEGGHQVQHSIWPQWDGEDDTFDILSLTGIERLPNLEELVVPSSKLFTLLPLAHLTRLRVVHLGTGEVEHLAPLQNIASLADVRLGGVEFPHDEANLRVVRELLRRGVKVTSRLLD